PVNSVKCMRGAFHALDEGKLVPYSTAAFEAYWGDDRDIAREEVLADIAAKARLHRQPLFFAPNAPGPCKRKPGANTDDLITRGGFGSPTMFVGSSMFFGNDRLPLVKAALEASWAPPPSYGGGHGRGRGGAEGGEGGLGGGGGAVEGRGGRAGSPRGDIDKAMIRNSRSSFLWP